MKQALLFLLKELQAEFNVTITREIMPRAPEKGRI